MSQSRSRNSARSGGRDGPTTLRRTNAPELDPALRTTPSTTRSRGCAEPYPRDRAARALCRAADRAPPRQHTPSRPRPRRAAYADTATARVITRRHAAVRRRHGADFRAAPMPRNRTPTSNGTATRIAGHDERDDYDDHAGSAAAPGLVIGWPFWAWSCSAPPVRSVIAPCSAVPFVPSLPPIIKPERYADQDRAPRSDAQAAAGNRLACRRGQANSSFRARRSRSTVQAGATRRRAWSRQSRSCRRPVAPMRMIRWRIAPALPAAASGRRRLWVRRPAQPPPPRRRQPRRRAAARRSRTSRPAPASAPATGAACRPAPAHVSTSQRCARAGAANGAGRRPAARIVPVPTAPHRPAPRRAPRRRIGAADAVAFVALPRPRAGAAAATWCRCRRSAARPRRRLRSSTLQAKYPRVLGSHHADRPPRRPRRQGRLSTAPMVGPFATPRKATAAVQQPEGGRRQLHSCRRN